MIVTFLLEIKDPPLPLKEPVRLYQNETSGGSRISKKPHENERNLIGGVRPWCPPWIRQWKIFSESTPQSSHEIRDKNHRAEGGVDDNIRCTVFDQYKIYGSINTNYSTTSSVSSQQH